MLILPQPVSLHKFYSPLMVLDSFGVAEHTDKPLDPQVFMKMPL